MDTYRSNTLSPSRYQHTHSTHRKHGRRKEHNKPPRQSRRGAQTPSSPEAARTKARPDERKPLSGSDELGVGYVMPGRIALERRSSAVEKQCFTLQGRTTDFT
jgi:hypothetical protein